MMKATQYLLHLFTEQDGGTRFGDISKMQMTAKKKDANAVWWP
jgi:hypothetical protein